MAWTERDLHAWGVLAPLSGDFLPWSEYSMRPADLVTVLSEIVLNRRLRVLECGPGMSTFYIAKLLAKHGGRLCSIENDAAWANWIGERLRSEGLDHHVQLVVAPLTECERGWGRSDWYDLDQVQEALDDSRFDMLVVDGPAAADDELMHARYPALPMLLPWLEDDCAVVLDDSERRGEQEVMARWEAETPFRFSRTADYGTIAFGKKPGSPGFDVADAALRVWPPSPRSDGGSLASFGRAATGVASRLRRLRRGGPP